MKLFNLPDLGEGLPDAEIVEWHVKEGDHVKEDQPMVSMETAKAVVDVPCPYTGVIAKLHGQPGDVIDTGAVLVEFAEAGEDISSAPAEDNPQQLKEDIEDLIDELEETLPVKSEKVSVSEDSGTVVGEMEATNQVVSDIKSVGKFKIAPAVKALAKKLKVDLNDVTPTGPGGVIRPSDIKLAHKNKSSAPAQEAAPVAASAPAPKVEAPVSSPAPQVKAPSTPITGDWEQVKGPRRAMARIMAESHAQIVPTTIMDDADIHNWAPGEDITARLIRALVKGVEAEPALNSWFNGEKLARRIINHVDIGIAVDTPDGLFVPTMRNCEQKSAADVRTRMNEIKQQVKSRSIPPEDMKDFTIMLSNFGVFAGRYATPVITPPCVAIIASGKLLHEVVPVLGGFEVHRVIPLSLTFDHRAVTGGEAARFLAAVIKDLNRAN
jgi:2-oxoisovalerate dehydrogenase E2 component (dihydrolipoyl transacylase)